MNQDDERKAWDEHIRESDYMCVKCEQLIDEDEWEMFGGKCEECTIEEFENEEDNEQ